MRFGQYIQKLREAKGLSLTDAARELGITPQRLCDIEKGRKNFQKQPKTDFLRNIAAVYDHPFANLVANTEYFQYEKSIVTDLLAELEPLSIELDQKVLEMLIEARQYTPEMETLAADTRRLTERLKQALVLANTRFGRGLRPTKPVP